MLSAPDPGASDACLMQGQADQAEKQQVGDREPRVVAVPVALITQAIPKRIAAMMASMPHCFPPCAALIEVNGG